MESTLKNELLSIKATYSPTQAAVAAENNSQLKENLTSNNVSTIVNSTEFEALSFLPDQQQATHIHNRQISTLNLEGSSVNLKTQTDAFTNNNNNIEDKRKQYLNVRFDSSQYIHKVFGENSSSEDSEVTLLTKKLMSMDERFTELISFFDEWKLAENKHHIWRESIESKLKFLSVKLESSLKNYDVTLTSCMKVNDKRQKSFEQLEYDISNITKQLNSINEFHAPLNNIVLKFEQLAHDIPALKESISLLQKPLSPPNCVQLSNEDFFIRLNEPLESLQKMLSYHNKLLNKFLSFKEDLLKEQNNNHEDIKTIRRILVSMMEKNTYLDKEDRQKKEMDLTLMSKSKSFLLLHL